MANKYAVIDTAKGGKIMRRFAKIENALDYQSSLNRFSPGDPGRYRIETQY